MPTVNDELLERTIRHQVYLTRLQSHEAMRVRSLLNDVIPDLLERVQQRVDLITARGFDAGPVTTQRLKDLSTAFAEWVDPQMTRVGKAFSEEMQRVAAQEAQWAAGVVEQAMPVDIEMTLPSPAQLRAVVSTEPIVGVPLEDWFGRLGTTAQNNVSQAVRMGIVEGQTTQQIVQRLRQDVFGLVKGQRARGITRNAEAIARTATNNASNQARLATYKANQDVVKGMKWVSTLDDRTSHICQTLDGRVYYFDRGPRPPGPPAHVGCRSSLSPITKSWRELGIPAKELTPGTRASMNGQVPATTNYNSWLRGRVQAGDMDTVREALGPSRAKLFAAGGQDVSSFTNRRGRLFTLAELRAKEPDVFARLNIRVPKPRG